MPGFYEDYFGSDGDVSAQARAQTVLLEVMHEALAWGQPADRLIIERDLARLTKRSRSDR